MARMQSICRVHVSREQRAILEALADGARAEEIAVLRKRSRSTIEAHVRTLFAKFNARSRAHLVAQAFRARVLRVDELARFTDL